MLTVNTIWKGWYYPPNCRKIRKKPGKSNQHNFLQVLFKSSSTTFKIILKLYHLWGLVMWPLLEGYYTQNQRFSRFFEYISASVWFLFMKSFLVTRSFQFLAVVMIMFYHECSSYPGNETQKPQFWPSLAIFVDFGHFSSYMFLNKPSV